jgi:hypothetical protein
VVSPDAAPAVGPAVVIHHELKAHVEPDRHRLEVEDEMTIPAALVTDALRLSLNADLAIASKGPGPKLRMLQRGAAASEVGMDRAEDVDEKGVRVNIYRIAGATPGRDLHITLRYQGIIDNPVTEAAQQYARGFSESPGLIETRGAYLAGSSHWVAETPDTLITYRLQTDLPQGWKSVSQGIRDESAPPRQGAGRVRESSGGGVRQGGGRVRETWRVDTPTEQAHLIAARFAEYQQAAGAVKAYAFLRTPDEALAARYLDATARYLQMYEALLGPYPYGKFALVENFWETGYGMPSFTLLGEQIIRFPFILTSSYPHELLHNYWGNGVFVDFRGGNWCEGLTAYLADHLLQEQRGQGGAHRRDILQRVTDYVTPQNDFPLQQFRARYDAATEAIGYGKGAMVWNMLRERVGDAQFVASLRRFYRENRFRAASFADIRRSFEVTTGEDLAAFFHQWIEQTGTPELELSDASRSGNRLTIRLTQVQAGPPLALEVPIVIQTARGVEVHRVALSSEQPATSASFDLDAPAARIDVDPQFQVYRRLSPLETAPSLSRAFGAERVLIVVPAGEEGVYSGLLKAWARTGVEVASDRDLAKLPDDRAVWVIGRSNRFLQDVDVALHAQHASLRDGALKFDEASYPVDTKSIIAAARNPANPAAVVVFLSAPTAAAADALARKLPHYGKYSWLVFGGDSADNEGKGEWPAGDSPLRRVFDADAAVTAPPDRKALVEESPVFQSARLRADVDWLAAPAREGRGIGSKGLSDAARYIADAFHAAGLQPLRDRGDYFEDFTLAAADGRPKTTSNVIGVIRGRDPALAGQSLVISAHYDHLGYGWPDAHAGEQGRLHPGADDNASGVAVLLELARVLANSHPDRSILFVAFSGEEEGLVGSRDFVRRGADPTAPYPLSGMLADLNLDTVGRLEGGSIAVFGGNSAREWPFIFSGITATTGIGTKVVTAGVDASDNTSFVEAGIPAVQFFASTAKDYHRPGDTADKIDIGGLIRVATVVKEASDYLATRPDRLHFAGAARPTAPPVEGEGVAAGMVTARRAATGIVPDMTDAGPGVRADSIAAGSGAEAAGLLSGDRLLSIGGIATPDLKSLSEALKNLRPGAIVEVEYQRDGEIRRAALTLGAR